MEIADELEKEKQARQVKVEKTTGVKDRVTQDIGKLLLLIVIVSTVPFLTFFCMSGISDANGNEGGGSALDTMKLVGVGLLILGLIGASLISKGRRK